jgi:hypothetical protein
MVVVQFGDDRCAHVILNDAERSEESLFFACPSERFFVAVLLRMTRSRNFHWGRNGKLYHHLVYDNSCLTSKLKLSHSRLRRRRNVQLSVFTLLGGQPFAFTHLLYSLRREKRIPLRFAPFVTERSGPENTRFLFACYCQRFNIWHGCAIHSPSLNRSIYVLLHS